MSQLRVQAVHPASAERRTNNPCLRRLVDPLDSTAAAGNVAMRVRLFEAAERSQIRGSPDNTGHAEHPCLR